MRLYRVNRLAALALTVVALPLFLSCGDDGPTNPQNRLIGTWEATRFEIEDVDFLDVVGSITLTFSSSGTYTIAVAGDINQDLCTGSTSCTLQAGEYSATSSRITFDPGEPEEIALNYTVSSSTLTISGTVAGPISIDVDWRFSRA